MTASQAQQIPAGPESSLFVTAALGFRGTVLLAVPIRPDQFAGIRCQDVISRALIENTPAHLFVFIV